LCFGGRVQLQYAEDVSLGELFFFPADVLGAISSPVFTEDNRFGVKLGGVHPGGIAERAGMKIDDVLVLWDQEEISDTHRPWKYFKGKDSKKISVDYFRESELVSTEIPCAPPLTNQEVEDRIAQLLGLKRKGEHFVRKKPVLSEKPLVSVLMHAYKPDWFREALQSVLDQSYQNIEIIIGDDNSKGEIKAIVDEMVGDDPRVQYFLHSPPLQGWGTGNRYFCFSKASGELIKYLCDDDILYPQCIEKMVNVLKQYPEVSLVTSYRRSIDGRGNSITPINPARRIIHYDSIIDGIRATNVFHGFGFNAIGEPSTTLFRQSQAEGNPFYVDTLGGVEAESGLDDVSLWCSLLAKGKLFYFAEALSAFRTSDQQGTADKRLMKDVHWKWFRQNKVFHEIGTLGFALEFRQQPIRVNTGNSSKEIEDMTALDLQEFLLDTEKGIDDPKRLLGRLRKFYDWPKLQFLLAGKIHGRYLPNSLKKCEKLTKKLKTSVFVSSYCPLVFCSMMYHKTYYLYFPSLGFSHKILCKVQCSDGSFEHRIVYSTDLNNWKEGKRIGDCYLIEMEENPIEHLIEFRGFLPSGEEIIVGAVELVSILPPDISLALVP
jgi:glycosyltransferase involved in cell wall biosynthesis